MQHGSTSNNIFFLAYHSKPLHFYISRNISKEKSPIAMNVGTILSRPFWAQVTRHSSPLKLLLPLLSTENVRNIVICQFERTRQQGRTQDFLLGLGPVRQMRKFYKPRLFREVLVPGNLVCVTYIMDILENMFYT